MARSRKSTSTFCRFAGVLLAWMALGTVGGCHGHYNRFAPARDRPHAVRRADHAVTAAERALDNAQTRVDNIVD